MSDPIVEPTVEPVVEPTPEPESGPVVLPNDHPLVKTLAAQKERIKELQGKSARLDEIEEANKTELQKAIERAEAAETVLADRDAKEQAAALIAEVAAEKNVPAAILRGATREELVEHADTYLSSLPVVPNAPSADGLGNVGVPLSEGVRQMTEAELNELMAQNRSDEVVKARDEGRLNDVLGIKTT